jgi:hypothetical protein
MRIGVKVYGRTAASFLPFSAVAQLDHFLLRKKLGLGQCSQKAPKTAKNLSAARLSCRTPSPRRSDREHTKLGNAINDLENCAQKRKIRGELSNNTTTKSKPHREHQVGSLLRDNQAALKFAGIFGAFCEHCSSPENCAAILVELRSSRKCRQTCGRPAAGFRPGASVMPVKYLNSVTNSELTNFQQPTFLKLHHQQLLNQKVLGSLRMLKVNPLEKRPGRLLVTTMQQGFE